MGRPLGLGLALLLSCGATAQAQSAAFITHDDSNQVPKNTAKSGNVILNDDNTQSNVAFAASRLTQPANGTVVLNADGSYVYTPNAGFTGADSFTYQVSQGGAISNSSTVFLNVYDPSVACTLGTGTNLLQNPSFTQGNIGFDTDYRYIPPSAIGSTPGSGFYAEGTYGVDTKSSIYFDEFVGTGRTGAPDDKFMFVNGAAKVERVYAQTVTVLPNRYYSFSVYACSVNPASPAQLGLVVGGRSTSAVTTLPDQTNKYVLISDLYYSGPGPAGGFPVMIEIRDVNKTPRGNDFGIDDVYFGSCSAFLVADTKTTTPVPSVATPAPIKPLSATINAGGSAGVTVSSFTIKSLPATGVLTYNGVPVVVGQVIPVSGPGSVQSGGSLTYTPVGGSCETSSHTFTYTATDSDGNGSSNIATYTIPVVPVPPVGIRVQGKTPFCPGENVRLSTSPRPGYLFTWYNGSTVVNGNGAGSVLNDSTFTATTAGSYKVKVELAGCSATSDPLRIDVLQGVAPGSIGADQTLCAGAAAASFTSITEASGGGGVGTYTYQWESSSNNTTWTPISGATSLTYAPGPISATTYFRRKVSSGTGACVFSYTSSIAITVVPAVAPGGIGADQTLCAGTTPAPLTSTAPASGGAGAGTYVYQWESSADNTTWTPISGATSLTYAPGPISATTYFRRNSTSGPCAPQRTAVVTLTLAPPITGGSTGTDQTLCPGATPAPLTSTTGAAGGLGNYAYQWESSANQTNWTPISGATGATYAPGPVAATTYFRRRVTSGAGACNTAYANTIALKVQSAVASGSIGDDQTLCAGTTPAPLTSTAPASGGSGTYTYQWESSSDNTTWAAIPGATGATYAPGPVSATTYFRRQVTSGTGTCATAYTPALTLTVLPALAPGSVGANQTICPGTTPAPLTSTAAASGGTASYAYQWESSTDNTTWTPISGANSLTYAPGPVSVTTYFRRQVRSGTGTCATAYTPALTLTVLPALAAGSIGADQTICPGTTPAPLTSTAPASGGTGTYTYQWESSADNTTWTPVSGATGATYAPGPASATTYYRRQVASVGNSTCGISLSNVVTVQLQTPLVSSVALSAPPAQCAGTAFTFTPVPANAGTAPTYRWFVNDVAVATGPIYTSTTLADGDQVKVELTPTAGFCASGPAVATVAVTLTTVPTPTLAIKVQPTGLVCPNTPLTFSIEKVTDAGPAPQYQWQVDGVDVPGAQGPTYTSTTLGNDQQVGLVLRTTTSCDQPTAVVSNPVRTTISPAVIVDAGRDKEIVEGGQVVLEGQANGTYPVVWTPTQGLNFTGGDRLRPTASPAVTTVYTLSAGPPGCESVSQVTVTVLPAVRIPNAFSPNGDNNDDTWEIDRIGNFPGNKVTVFNRWGNEVFSAKNYSRSNEWDGKIKGQPAPIGTYYYVITLGTGKSYSGPITIVY